MTPNIHDIPGIGQFYTKKEVDGLLRILGIIPPFMDIDVNVIDNIVEKVESDIIPQVEKYKSYIPRI